MTRETHRPAWPGSNTSISFGLPFTAAATQHVEQTFAARKVYILASASLAADTRHVRDLQAALGDRVAGGWVGMKPHTLWSECLRIAADARHRHADLIVTMGGGSLTDAAKVIALALANDTRDFEGLRNLTTAAGSATAAIAIKAPEVPTVCIPTTLSGGECNDRAGGTDDETKRKFSFAGAIKGPRLVILDPALTTSTPGRWWLSTGVRAIDHCVEAMCSLQRTEETDRDAVEEFKGLVPGLLRCKEDGQDPDARLRCQLAVISAVKATKGAPMGASHGIGHQLGPLGVGHGETSCVLLPAVCKFNRSANRAQQQKVIDIFKTDAEVSKSIFSHLGDASDPADVLTAYFTLLGLPTTLSAVGVNEDQFEELARTSLTDRHLATNPIPITKAEQVTQMLRLASGRSEK